MCWNHMKRKQTAEMKDVPYVVIILLVSLKSRMPLGDDTSNCSLWDLRGVIKKFNKKE